MASAPTETQNIIDLEQHEVEDHQSRRDAHYFNKLSRMIAEKERSCEHVKHEVRIIWGDFYKAPQFSEYPELQDLVHEIMLRSSQCKQNVDQAASRQLVTKINRFAEIFWSIKGINSFSTKYHCKPNLDIVFPDFK